MEPTTFHAGITVRRDEDGAPVALLDDVLLRTVDLREVARDVVRGLDGVRTLEDLRQYARGAGHDSVAVDNTLRSLLCLAVFDSSGASIRERVSRARRVGDDADVVVLPGTRFECQGSGACCQNYRFGPLGPRDVERLQALPIWEHFPHRAGMPLVEELAQRDGGTALYLPTEGDHCVYLDENRRCGLHGKFGAAAKPDFCRLYPLELVPTLNGRRFYDRGTCASHARASSCGDTLDLHASQLRDVLPRKLDFYHPIVFVGDRPLDYGHFQRLCDLLLRIADEPGVPAPTRVVAMAAAVEGWGARMREFPVVDGQPERDLEMFVGGLLAPWFEHASRVMPDRAALRALVVDLLAEVDALADDNPGTRLMMHPLARDLAGTLAALETWLGSGAEVHHGVSMDAEMDAALRRSQRQHLWGRRALIQDHPMAAMLRLGVTGLLAVMHAERTGEGGFNRGHMLAMRVLEGSGEIFRRHQEHAVGILAQVAQLVALR